MEFCAPLDAAQQTASVQAEISTLLSALESSGCQFNRNGTWYNGSDARSHLLEKLRNLESKVTIQSAEQFIEIAASASSISGTPYMVRCGVAGPVPSNVWLRAKLQELRVDAGANAPTKR